MVDSVDSLAFFGRKNLERKQGFPVRFFNVFGNFHRAKLTLKEVDPMRFQNRLLKDWFWMNFSDAFHQALSP